MDENSKLTKFQLPVAQSRLDISLPLAIMWACDFETLVAHRARGGVAAASQWERIAFPSLCVRFKTFSVALR